jgi:hypothetical protein
LVTDRPNGYLFCSQTIDILPQPDPQPQNLFIFVILGVLSSLRAKDSFLAFRSIPKVQALSGCKMSFKANSILNYFQKSGSTPLKPLPPDTTLSPKPSSNQKKDANGSTPRQDKPALKPRDEKKANDDDSDNEPMAPVGCFGDGPSQK